MQNIDPPDADDIAPARPAAGNLYAVFKIRDFALYLAARLFATFGQQMFAMALGWELYDRTHSALALGFVGLTQMIPMVVFTIPAGHAADHYNRKRIIVFTTILLAAANVAMTAVSAFKWPIWSVYFCLIVTASARTFLWAATASFLPTLVGRSLFSRAVTWNVSMFQISSIAGPAVAGLLIRMTNLPALVYLANALCAVVCCVLFSRLKTSHVITAKTESRSVLTGFNFVFGTRIILGIITLDMFAVLFGGSTAILPVYAKDILKVGPQALGLLQGALPAGAILCGFVLAHRPPMQKAGRALLLAVALFGVATIVFGVSRWFWLSALMLLICGAADNVSVVIRHTLVQLLTPDEKRGRVSAVNNLFIGTSNELGEFESGTVAHWFGPVFSVVSGGIGAIVVVLGVAWVWPEIRNYGRLDERG